SVLRLLRVRLLALVDVLEVHLGELRFLGEDRGTRERRHAGEGTCLCRLLAWWIAVAQELEVREGRNRLVAAIDDVVSHVDDIAAAMEGEPLHHFGTIRLAG